jgi:hypothetical protein
MSSRQMKFVVKESRNYFSEKKVRTIFGTMDPIYTQDIRS